MTRCIFHIDLDAFFVSVERTLNPNLMKKPVIVGGDPSRHGVVASASYEARPFGIHAGMPLSKAHHLCPQAIFIQADFSHYRESSQRFMEILADFSPHIEPLSIDEAYLDVSGYEEPFGSSQKLALVVKKRIYEELKLTASIGIATCKVIAKIASDLCKPNGLLEVAPGEEHLFLNPLPLAKLPGVGKKTEQVLQEMGIATIGQLATLPLDTMKKRFGKFGTVIHSYANGIDDREVEAPGGTKSISKQTTFAKDNSDRHYLEASLHYLCDHVSTELRYLDQHAKCVVLKLRYTDFKTITRQVTLKEATDVSHVIFDTALQLLRKTLTQKEKAIRLIGIKLSSLSGKEKQLYMFDTRIEKWRHLDKAIAQIRRKYGASSLRKGKDIFI
ncbi:MAG: DNA polymerase IV [Dehalococcoidia bacterium]|nr:DNA polymerase IV [Dehalococcoidia bacterium]